MKRIMIALVVMGLLSVAPRAEAGLITFEETVTATGSLGGTPFTDALVTLIATADTSNVTTTNLGSLGVNVTSATVNVSGIGTATFAVASLVFDNQSSMGAGLEEGTVSNQQDDILDVTNAAFASYGLTTSIGPLSGSALINSGASFATTDGAFIIDSTSGSATFEATLQSAAVPEPSFFMLASTLTLTGLGYGWRKRRAMTPA